jgi:hypothetical protein
VSRQAISELDAVFVSILGKGQGEMIFVIEDSLAKYMLPCDVPVGSGPVVNAVQNL